MLRFRSGRLHLPSKVGSRRNWTKIIIRFASAQGLVQVLSFILGITIVSSIDKESYAEYTVVVALIAAMVALSEAGLSSVILSIGGRVANNPNRISSLFAAALKFRLRIGLVVAVCGNVVLVVALQQIGTDNLTLALYVAIACATLVPILAKGVFQVYLRLTLDIATLQRLALFSSLFRFVLIMPLALAHLANVQILLAVGLLIAFLEAWFFRRRVKRALDLGAKPLDVDKARFRKSFKQTLPMNLPFVLQGQALYLLLAWLGSAFVLAEIAALSRFGLVFVVFNAVITDIASGYLARQGGTTTKLLKVYLSILFAYVVSAALLVTVVFSVASPLVGLLGEEYAGLEVPLVVVAAGSALINIGTTLVTLNHSRGWLSWSWIFLPMTAVWCAFGVFFLDLGNVFEAAVFMAAQAVPLLVTQLVCLIAGARGHRRAGQPIVLDSV